MALRVVLLLNLAILICNFALSLGTQESQIRILRAASRVVHEPPLERCLRTEDAGPRGYAAGVPEVRLFRYVGRLPEFDRLSSRQVAAVYGSFEQCCDAAARGGAGLRRSAFDGEATRRSIERLRSRLREGVAESLRAAEIDDARLLEHLVRIVLSSAG
jgi:hypothetical protein